jgi:copper homeostasis protein
VIDLGFSSVLSSGGERTALHGANRLNKLIQQASGRLEIVVGGGVRAENITALREVVQPSFYHSACITEQGGSADAEEIKRILEELNK